MLNEDSIRRVYAVRLTLTAKKIENGNNSPPRNSFGVGRRIEALNGLNASKNQWGAEEVRKMKEAGDWAERSRGRGGEGLLGSSLGASRGSAKGRGTPKAGKPAALNKDLWFGGSGINWDLS